MAAAGVRESLLGRTHRAGGCGARIARARVPRRSDGTQRPPRDQAYRCSPSAPCAATANAWKERHAGSNAIRVPNTSFEFCWDLGGAWSSNKMLGLRKWICGCKNFPSP